MANLTQCEVSWNLLGGWNLLHLTHSCYVFLYCFYQNQILQEFLQKSIL